jgi:hypothetical protein
MALSGECFHDHNIPRSEAPHRAISNAHLHLASKDEHVLVAGGIVPIDKIADGITGKSETGGIV